MAAFFDCYCALGHLTAPTFGQEFPTVADLLTAMDHAGIDEALVYAAPALEYDPPAGNQFLMEAIGGHPTLHPCWVLLPPATHEFPPPDELVTQMAREGVRAARLAPGATANNFSMAEWSVGPLLAALARAKVPLFINLADVSWTDIAAMLTHHPELPLILTGVTYRIDRFLYPLWEQHNTLYVELSGYQGLHAVETTVGRFGPDRLLFGTNQPRFAAGSAVATVAYAQVDETARGAIAGGTLRRLLEAAHDN